MTKNNYLDSCCGDGEFLSNLLDERLQALFVMDKKVVDEFNILSVLTDIYGLDTSKDNVKATRLKLMRVAIEHHKKIINQFPSDMFLTTLLDIVESNIQVGDCFTDKSISFTEWQVPMPLTFNKQPFSLNGKVETVYYNNISLV